MPSRPRLRDIGSVLCSLLFSIAAQSATVTVHCGGSGLRH